MVGVWFCWYFMPLVSLMRARVALKLHGDRLVLDGVIESLKTAKITRAYYNTVIHARN
jgi:hypothetical protein